MAEIHEITSRRDRARQLRRMLVACLRRNFVDFGDDLAGFALVTWDARGDAHSSYFADDGPVGESLVPVFTADALNRHIAVALAERTRDDRIDGQ